MKVAVLVTDRREVLTGQAGEVVANRYRIARIGLESVDLEDVGVADVRCPGEALDRAVLGLPADHLGDVEAVGVVDAAGRVGDGDDGRALLADEPGSY